MKDNARYEVIERRPVPRHRNILSDEITGAPAPTPNVNAPIPRGLRDWLDDPFNTPPLLPLPEQLVLALT